MKKLVFSLIVLLIFSIETYAINDEFIPIGSLYVIKSSISDAGEYRKFSVYKNATVYSYLVDCKNDKISEFSGYDIKKEIYSSHDQRDWLPLAKENPLPELVCNSH